MDPAVTPYPDYCNYAFPGLECNYPEMLVLGILFWICALVSIVLLTHAIRKVDQAKHRFFFLDQTVLFWFSLAIWQIYRGILFVIPFHFNVETYHIWYTSVEQMVMFIPMCLVILLLFDLLFTYRNPGTNAMLFFRSLFLLFLVTFTVLGILLCVLDFSSNKKDTDLSMSLWCACTDLVLAIFFALPARALLEAVNYPMVQKEDVCCVNFCKVGIVLYVLLFGGRMLWNGTHYFGANKLQDWIFNDVDVNGRPKTGARVINFLLFFFWDFVSSIMSMISVFLFKKHEIMFSENPYYNRGQ
jgi:hypothetical protein